MVRVEHPPVLRTVSLELRPWPDAVGQRPGRRGGPAFGILLGLLISLGFWGLLLGALL